MLLAGAPAPCEAATITTVGLEVTVAVDVLVEVGVLVKVAVAKAIVIVAPVEGKPVKLTGWPFVPTPAVTLN